MDQADGQELRDAVMSSHYLYRQDTYDGRALPLLWHSRTGRVSLSIVRRFRYENVDSASVYLNCSSEPTSSCKLHRRSPVPSRRLPEILSPLPRTSFNVGWFAIR